jgi:protein TonB
MLEDAFVESRPFTNRRKPLTLVVSVLTHGGILALLLLVPLFGDQVLPQVAGLQPLPPPTVHRAVVPLVPASARAARSTSMSPTTGLLAPQVIPKDIAAVNEDPIADLTVFTTTVGGTSRILTSILGTGVAGPEAGPPPPPPAPPRSPEPPPPPAPPAPLAPVRVGGAVLVSKLIFQVAPSYPPLARASRTQGVVILEAVITGEGTIDPARLRILSGHPLLNQAAVDAVRKWRYQPTLLNGQPMEILSTITVNFSFSSMP